MPIEIRELVIKTTVESSNQEDSGASSEAKSGGKSEAVSKKDLQKMKDRIVEECMNRINDHLRTINDR